MSYRATREDISDAWEEYYIASETLGNTLDDAQYNVTLNQKQHSLCKYLDAQLQADRLRIEQDIQKILEYKNEEI